MTTAAESGEPRKPKLVVQNVSKAFVTGAGPVKALENVTFQVHEGELITCLVGPSGSGKSTLLNIIAGLEAPDSGTVTIDDQPVTKPGRERMMIFQDSALFPWLNVIDNVMFGLRLSPEKTRQERREIAEHFLKIVGLDRFMRAFIHELSGGMRQRVALARALAPDPTFLLMDEPFASLDAMTREQLYADLQQIWQDQKKYIIFVTHNVREAICLGDRVLLFSASPGSLEDEFQIRLPRPRNINSVEVAQHATAVTAALKWHTSGAAAGGVS